MGFPIIAGQHELASGSFFEAASSISNKKNRDSPQPIFFFFQIISNCYAYILTDLYIYIVISSVPSPSNTKSNFPFGLGGFFFFWRRRFNVNNIEGNILPASFPHPSGLATSSDGDGEIGTTSYSYILLFILLRRGLYIPPPPAVGVNLSDSKARLLFTYIQVCVL